MGADRYLVAHRARHDKETVFMGGEVCDERLERVGGWVFGVDIVEEGGIRYRCQHGLSWCGEDIRAEIEAGRTRLLPGIDDFMAVYFAIDCAIEV